MIKATINLKTGKGSGLEDLAKRLEKMEDASVKVGLPSGKEDASVIEYAIYNHEGTEHIPARPFITIAMHENEDVIMDGLKSIAKAALHGEQDLKTGLGKIGAFAAGKIQETIAGSLPPPNDPKTIKQKGSSTTLIDTGRLRQSITWEYKE